MTTLTPARIKTLDRIKPRGRHRRPGHWTMTDLPTGAYRALVAAEEAGVAVDLTGDPVFYEIKMPFIGMTTNMGGVCGSVVEAVKTVLSERDVPWHHVTAITTAIRNDAYLSGNFDAGLGSLLRWVGVHLEDE